MKSLLVVATLITAFASAAAIADTEGPDCYRVWKVSKNGTLSLRKKPSIKSTKLAEIPTGFDGLKNLAKCTPELSDAEVLKMSQAKRKKFLSRQWCRVQYKDIQGWAKATYLAEGSCAE
jgi:hypothetical protein